MDKLKISSTAAILKRILDHYAQIDREAALLKSALSSILRAEESGEINSPLEWNKIPGGIFFTEGNLRQYRDLEDAYANFKIEVTGGDTPVLRKLRLDLAKKNKIQS